MRGESHSWRPNDEIPRRGPTVARPVRSTTQAERHDLHPGCADANVGRFEHAEWGDGMSRVRVTRPHEPVALVAACTASQPVMAGFAGPASRRSHTCDSS